MDMGIKKIIFAGNKEPFTLAFQSIMGTESVWVSGQNFESVIQAEDPKTTLFILNTADDISSQVIKWLWNKLRLNEERLGRRIAGLPVLVFGMNKKFTETDEGIIFEDFPTHHQYLTKPLNLYRLLEVITILSPIDPSSLCEINRNSPETLLSILEHDFRSVSKKFDHTGTDKEIEKKFHDLDVKLKIYESREKYKKRVQRVKKEVEKLKREIIKRRGNIWH